MKPALLFAIAFLWTANAQAEKTKKTDVDLGRKPSCIGFGICNAKTSNGNSVSMQAIWTINTEQTILTMTIENAQMEKIPVAIESAMEDGVFAMPDPFTFTNDIATALGMSEGLVIPAGSYSVARNSVGYVVTFRIQ
jgi:hypothetical protein